MPVALTYPGVYIEEIPSGVRTITTVSTSITAFVGYTARGPIDQAVRLKNFGDFERSFGGLARDSEVAYAVQQFFLNGGADAYVVRVAQGAASASITLKFGSGATDNALIAEAASAGIWGNDIRIEVDYKTANPDSTFNLTIIRSELQRNVRVDVERESYLNLSMNSHSPTYALSVVNAGSKLIKLSLPPAGLTFADRGFSLSGSLATFPTLTAADTTLSLIVDGADAVTLTLTNPAGVTNIPTLVTALTAAIAAAGQAARLVVERVNALGATAAGGNFVKLTSQNVAANPNTAPEFSSVQLIASPSNDVAPKLRLGRGNGGREKEGSSTRRPLPNGTLSGDLANILGTNVSGPITVTVNDNSTGASTLVVTGAVALPSTAVGEALRLELETQIRSIVHPATQNASVRLEGTRLRVTPSAATPNASIVLTDTGAAAALLTGASSFVNLQGYQVGVGATFGGQTGASAGNDGVSPSSATFITGSRSKKTGIYALLDVDLFNLLAIPLTTKLTDSEAKAVITEAIALCTERRAFYLVDPDPLRDRTDIIPWADQVGSSKNAALYFPQIQAADPLDGFRLKNMPASGAIAGIYARTDSERGVWKAPAGTEAVIRGAQGLKQLLTDPENGDLNPVRVNTLRNFPIFGTVVWGARTMEGADAQASEWKYVPVRRTALFIEESLYRGVKWVVFEPNDEPLWAQIRLNIGAFMQDLFRQGAFQGRTPREAYFVKCDSETTTQNDINRGIVNILVGFAPLKPAEFVVIMLQQMAGQIQV